jgi:Secretion system C-terminal sorting domain
LLLVGFAFFLIILKDALIILLIIENCYPLSISTFWGKILKGILLIQIKTNIMKNIVSQLLKNGLIRKHIAILVFIIPLIVNGLHATTYTWGGGTGDWSDGTKWLPNGVPIRSDDAIINSGIVNVGDGHSISSLTLNGGSIVGDFNQFVMSNFFWNGGTISHFNKVDIYADCIISGSNTHFLDHVYLSPKSDCEWNSGNISFCDGGIIRIETDKTLYVYGSSDKKMYDSCNTGISRFYLLGNFEKSGTGILTIEDVAIEQNANSIISVFEGTLLLKMHGYYSEVFQGTFDVSDGATLNFGGGDPQIDGATFIGEGDFVIEKCTINFKADVTFPKIKLLERGKLGGNFNITIVGETDWQGGGFVGTGTVNLNGYVLMSSAFLKEIFTKTVILNAGGTWSEGYLRFCDGAILRIPIGQTLLENGVSKPPIRDIYLCAGAGSYDIQGTFIHESGQSYISPFTNTGSVIVQSGELYTSSSSTYTNNFNIATNAKLVLFGGVIDNFTYTGDGTLGLAGNFNFNSNKTFHNLEIGASGYPTTLKGNVDFTITGTFGWGYGGFDGTGTVNVLGQTLMKNDASTHSLHIKTVNLNGGGIWSGGDLDLCGDAIIRIPVGTTLTVEGSSSKTLYGYQPSFGSFPCGSPIFDLKGTLIKNGTGDLKIFSYSTFKEQFGQIDINNGSITLREWTGQSIKGKYNIAFNGILTFDDAVIVENATFDGEGTVYIPKSSYMIMRSNVSIPYLYLGGIIDGNYNITARKGFTWREGKILEDIAGTGSVTVNGPTLIYKLASDSKYTLEKNLILNGGGTWEEGELVVSGDIIIAANTTFNINSNNPNDVLKISGAADIENYGTLIKSGVSNLLIWGTNFLNQGTFNWTNGKLSTLGCIFSNKGVFNINAPLGSAENVYITEIFNCGTINNQSFLSTLQYHSCPNGAKNGVLSGTGRIDMNYYIMTDTVRPGNSPGVITFNPYLIAGFDDPFGGNGQSPTFEMEIKGGYGMTGIADDADRIESSNFMQFTGGTLKLILNNPEVGSYTIFKLTGTTGTISGFSSLNILYSVNGGAFTATPPPNMNIQVNANSVVVNITGTVLPLELLSFQAQNTEGSNKLTWQTATETNTSHFDIERSPDGKTFEKIGAVKAKGSNRTYQYVDKIGVFSTIYYRLKINDLDGKSEYSKVVNLTAKVKGFSAKVYPNPLKDQATIEITTEQKTDVSIELYDMIGRQVKRLKAENTEGVVTIPFDIKDLSNGTYFLKISNNTNVIQQKIVKQE